MSLFILCSLEVRLQSTADHNSWTRFRVCGSTLVPRRLQPQAWKRCQAENKVMLKQFSLIDIGMPKWIPMTLPNKTLKSYIACMLVKQHCKNVQSSILSQSGVEDFPILLFRSIFKVNCKTHARTVPPFGRPWHLIDDDHDHRRWFLPFIWQRWTAIQKTGAKLILGGSHSLWIHTCRFQWGCMRHGSGDKLKKICSNILHLLRLGWGVGPLS